MPFKEKRSLLTPVFRVYDYDQDFLGPNDVTNPSVFEDEPLTQESRTPPATTDTSDSTRSPRSDLQ